MHEQAKANERWWARYFNGQRHPSQGVVYPDVSGLWFTLEHKYRKFEDYPSEIRKAILQKDSNASMFPNKIPFIALSLHQGRGRKTRRFIVYEVTQDTFEKELEKINEARRDVG